MTDLDVFNRAWLAARKLPARYAGESDDVRRLVDAGLLSPFPGGCAINLAFLVRKPFTPYAHLDLVHLRHVARARPSRSAPSASSAGATQRRSLTSIMTNLKITESVISSRTRSEKSYRDGPTRRPPTPPPARSASRPAGARRANIHAH